MQICAYMLLFKYQHGHMLLHMYVMDHWSRGCTCYGGACLCQWWLLLSQAGRISMEAPQGWLVFALFSEALQTGLAGSRRKIRLVPRKTFWYLWVVRSIGKFMFSNATWCRHRGSASQQDFHDYEISQNFLVFLLLTVSPRSKTSWKGCLKYGLYRVAFDLGNMFQFCCWSTGIMFIGFIMLLTVLHLFGT